MYVFLGEIHLEIKKYPQTFKMGSMVKTMQEPLLLVCSITKIQTQVGHGGTHLSSQHLGG